MLPEPIDQLNGLISISENLLNRKDRCSDGITTIAILQGNTNFLALFFLGSSLSDHFLEFISSLVELE